MVIYRTAIFCQKLLSTDGASADQKNRTVAYLGEGTMKTMQEMGLIDEDLDPKWLRDQLHKAIDNKQEWQIPIYEELFFPRELVCPKYVGGCCLYA